MLLIAGILTGWPTKLAHHTAVVALHRPGCMGYVMWGMGTFGDVTTRQVPWFATTLVCLGLVGALLLAKPLNILMLGDNYASISESMWECATCCSLITGVLTAIITAWCGPVAFVGLAMPHIARMIFPHRPNRGY